MRNPEKVGAVWAKLGGKNRSRPISHRPVSRLGQFSLAGLLTLATAAGFLYSIWLRRTSTDEFVYVGAVSIVLGIVTAGMLFRMCRPRRA